MTRRHRVTHQLQAQARMLELIGDRYPLLIDHLTRELTVVDGHKDHTPASSIATASPSLPKSGRCEENTPDPDGELVQCPHRRPCPNHDGATLTVVERGAAQRLRLHAVKDDVDAGIRLIAVTISDVLDTITRAMGTRLKVAGPARCNSMGREGAQLPWTPGAALDAGNGWSNPSCQDAASHGPLCSSCSKREQRWRMHHNLPLRSDGAYSQPGGTAA